VHAVQYPDCWQLISLFIPLLEYEINPEYFGAVIGRVVNRIFEGKFELDGTEYTISLNRPPNSIHGGFIGFDKVITCILYCLIVFHLNDLFQTTAMDGIFNLLISNHFQCVSCLLVPLIKIHSYSQPSCLDNLLHVHCAPRINIGHTSWLYTRCNGSACICFNFTTEQRVSSFSSCFVPFPISLLSLYLPRNCLSHCCQSCNPTLKTVLVAGDDLYSTP